MPSMPEIGGGKERGVVVPVQVVQPSATPETRPMEVKPPNGATSRTADLDRRKSRSNVTEHKGGGSGEEFPMARLSVGEAATVLEKNERGRRVEVELEPEGEKDTGAESKEDGAVMAFNLVSARKGGGDQATEKAREERINSLTKELDTFFPKIGLPSGRSRLTEEESARHAAVRAELENLGVMVVYSVGGESTAKPEKGELERKPERGEKRGPQIPEPEPPKPAVESKGPIDQDPPKDTPTRGAAEMPERDPRGEESPEVDVTTWVGVQSADDIIKGVPTVDAILAEFQQSGGEIPLPKDTPPSKEAESEGSNKKNIIVMKPQPVETPAERTREDNPRLDEFVAPELTVGRTEIVLPVVGVHVDWTVGKVMGFPSTAVGLAQLNTFLEGIGNQGARIASTRTVVVDAKEDWQTRVPGVYGENKRLEDRIAVTVDRPTADAQAPRYDYRAVLVPRWGTPVANTRGQMLEPLQTHEYERRYEAFVGGLAAEGYAIVAALEHTFNIVEEERKRVPNFYDNMMSVNARRTVLLVERPTNGINE